MFQSEKRPKLHIAKTKSEWVWDIIGYACYISSILFLFYHWSDIPNSVPTHYNAFGEVDRWGAKAELFILPIIGAFLAVFMSLLEKYPEIHNYPKRFNKENARDFYLVSRKMLNQTKNFCLIIFALLLFESISIALGREMFVGKWLLPLILVGVSVLVVAGIIKQRKIR